ncbi:MAG TPA: mannosyltransferase family protein [Gaiella sp.]|nr:mannosyltransferase family protein [Gaiella sp.]
MRGDVLRVRPAPRASRVDASTTPLSASVPLRIFVWSRLAVWALAAATVLLFGDHLNPARGRWDSPRLHELGAAFDVWARWDSDWYLRIAESGYRWPSSTPAFFPLYPGVVAGLGRALGDRFLLAGVLVSLAACAATFVLLHELVRLRLGASDARRTVLYLALFPTSLFLGAVYGESLFLLLAVATFVLGERGRFGWASVAAGLAMLARAQGIALVPALALLVWRSERRLRALWVVVVPIAMFAVFPLVLEAWVGHGLAFLDAQRVWDRSLAPLGPLGGVVQAVGEGDVLGPALAVALVVLAVVAWKALGAPYGIYALGALALPMAFPSERLGGLYSFPRLALAAFPCLAALAVLGRGRRVHGVLVAVLGAGLAVCVVRWALWYWVS